MGSQAQALKKRTATGYDSGLYEVNALPLGPVRAIAAATAIGLLFALMVYLNVQEQADRRNFRQRPRVDKPGYSRSGSSATELGLNPPIE